MSSVLLDPSAVSKDPHPDHDKTRRIDPDALSRLLPERPQYLKSDAGTASALLHPEASLLQEIIAAVARQQRRSLVVDGSLTDCQWFEGFMRWVQPACCLKQGTRTLIQCCHSLRVRRRYHQAGYDCEILFVVSFVSFNLRLFTKR